jgi:uncharacterized metal-binding protein
LAKERCECEATSVLVFPCSGGSNVGQLANAAGIELSKRGKVNFYCLAGMGAHVAGMVDSAQHADYRIAIDGCPVACARKTLEQAGVPVEKAIVITELGITKNHELVWTLNELDLVVDAVLADKPITAGDDCSCGCSCSGGN